MIRAIKIKAGEYRVGNFVAIREDSPSVGDRYDRWGNVVAYGAPSGSRTWGLVHGATYDRMNGDVGLPEAVAEFATLGACVEYVRGTAYIERY